MNNSNIGKWDGWYKQLPNTPSAFRYSDTITYQIAADFLSDCEVVEDWGVGGGGFLNYRPDAIGIDGSNTPFAQKTYIDLCEYVSSCDGVHMRHVLEHNYNWKQILINALRSARKKVHVTLFIKPSDGETTEIAHNLKHGVDVPDLAISHNEFMKIITDVNPKSIDSQSFNTPTGYGYEMVVKITLHD